MKVIITMPAYNEGKTIGRVIADIKEVMDSTKYNYTILVVDDGSKDNTAKVAKEAGVKVVSHQVNFGLAETFRTEIRECLKLKADIIVHTDADGQYPAKYIPKLIEEVEKGNGLVLGSRFRGKIESMLLAKKLGNMAFSRVISRITKLKISDGQTGFRAFTKEVAERVKVTSTFTYTQEQIIKAVREKIKIKEIPIFFARRRGSTKSRLMKNPFDYAIKAWINLLRLHRDYDPLKFFGLIGMIFFGIGFLIGLHFIYLHFTSGISGHLGLLFLMLLLITTGIQTFVFGFMADMNRK